MEVQLDGIHQRAPDPLRTHQPNRDSRGGTPAPNNGKWSLPLQILVRFNTLASRVEWGDVVLQYQFYDGLPDRLKDWITLLGKPDSLRELVQVTIHHDNLYWECQDEHK